jgi:O-antigen/teichoic acid export membrane protein
VWIMAAAAGAFLLCCAGPLVFALLATTGLGLALAPGGTPLVAAGGLVAVLVATAILWQRRRACARRVPRGSSVPARPRRARDGVTPPRPDRAKVP